MQLYTFGSPRVGNDHFAQLFTTLPLQAVYRVVNGSDVVARVPRSMNALWAQVCVCFCLLHSDSGLVGGLSILTAITRFMLILPPESGLC